MTTSPTQGEHAQPEALRLADELEDSLESHDGSSLTARCQGIADEAAAELRRLHAQVAALTAPRGGAYAELPVDELRTNYLDLLQEVLDAKDVMLAAGCKQGTFAVMFAEYRASHGQAPAGWLDCENVKPRALNYPLSDYHRAPGDGPLNATWKDKPHRIVYDLIAAVRYYAQHAPTAQPAPAGDEPKALAALRYYMTECTGAEPSISVFHRMVDEALEAQAAPAATPQADSQPTPSRYRDKCTLGGRCLGGCLSTEPCYYTDRAARAPADSVTAPAAGAVAGPVEQQVQRIGKELLRSEQMHAAKPDRIASALRAMSESMHTDYKQEIGSNNCMQCCVAYMLGMPISQVPHFAQSNDPVACWDGFQSFIAKQGYTAVMLPGDQRPESHYLASGKSARGTSHMVVMHDGKLLHDPHPTNAGLVDVQCIWLLAKSAAAPTPAAQAADSVLEDAALSQAARDVLTERQRQVKKEGWTRAHDDEHADGSLAAAAACYAIVSVPSRRGEVPVSLWPKSWAPSWWKPSNPRRNLVKAGALILAEMERIDRAARKQGANHD